MGKETKENASFMSWLWATIKSPEFCLGLLVGAAGITIAYIVTSMLLMAGWTVGWW